MQFSKSVQMDYELIELKREFLDEARGKVDEMRSALRKGGTGEALELVAYLAHQLKGSGGSYGYERITADAAELERAVETMTSNRGNGPEREIEQFIGSLSAEIERAVTDLQA